MRAVYPLRGGRALIPIFFHTARGLVREVAELDSGSTITVLPRSILRYIVASPPKGRVMLMGALGEVEEAEVREVPVVVEGVQLTLNAAFSSKSESKLISVADLAKEGFATTFSGDSFEVLFTGCTAGFCAR